MTQINAYINFSGNAREAMSFYKDCFGGELLLQKIGESPMAAQLPGELANKILHGHLKSNGLELMGSDCMGEAIVHGDNIWLNVNCSSDEEIHQFFDSLAKGGKITEPLHQTFWGATFGELTDKFGIHWMFNYSKK
jgi:PhnB protein